MDLAKGADAMLVVGTSLYTQSALRLVRAVAERAGTQVCDKNGVIFSSI